MLFLNSHKKILSVPGSVVNALNIPIHLSFTLILEGCYFYYFSNFTG